MKLLSALKKGKWVRRKTWIDYTPDSWYTREGVFLIDKCGYVYELDISDFEATDWEVKK